MSSRAKHRLDEYTKVSAATFSLDCSSHRGIVIQEVAGEVAEEAAVGEFTGRVAGVVAELFMVDNFQTLLLAVIQEQYLVASCTVPFPR